MSQKYLDIYSESIKNPENFWKKIADKEPYKMPATIDDPVILDEIKEELVKQKIL